MDRIGSDAACSHGANWHLRSASVMRSRGRCHVFGGLHITGGMTEANVKVAQSPFHVAIEGKNLAAPIFSMKARAGWREKPLPDNTKGPVITGIERIIIDSMQLRKTIEGEATVEPDC